MILHATSRTRCTHGFRKLRTVTEKEYDMKYAFFYPHCSVRESAIVPQWRRIRHPPRPSSAVAAEEEGK